MKLHPALSLKRGFTLMELMVAMAITVIIVTVLVSITAMATETWNRSRLELRAARQAKTMVDTMARDFETLVTRRGNNDFEWLSAITPGTLPGDSKVQSTNACDMIFLAGTMDRYEGNIGVAGKDLGGDVSGIGYLLDYKDPIDKSGTVFKTFVFKRLLVDPDKTFKDLLGKTDLTAGFAPYKPELEKVDKFICENIYQFTITFNVVVTRATPASGSTAASTQTLTVPVTIGNTPTWPMVKSLKIKGTGIVTDPLRPTAVQTGELKVDNVTDGELKAGRVSAIEISLSVITDSGVTQLSRRTFSDAQKAEFLMKNSYNYVRRVQVNSM